MSNINSDLLDEDLQAVMGKDRCQNEWTVPKKKEKPCNVKQDEPMDAGWVQLNTVSPMVRLKNCVKWGTPFAVLSSILFYWQQAGLLASSAAVPSLIICALGAGLTVGYHAR